MVALLEAVDRPTALGEQVYETLRKHVLDGAIAAGQALQEVPLATRLGVSRTPVREALARLASEGLLVSGGRSFIVPALTLADVDDIYEVRLLIEPAAIRRVAARTVDTTVREPIEKALAAAISAHRSSDAMSFREANTRFHGAWLALVPNARLVKVIGQYADHVRRARALTLSDAETRRIVLAGLDRITVALRVGAGEAAATALHEHLLQARLAFIGAVGLLDGTTSAAA